MSTFDDLNTMAATYGKPLLTGAETDKEYAEKIAVILMADYAYKSVSTADAASSSTTSAVNVLKRKLRLNII